MTSTLGTSACSPKSIEGKIVQAYTTYCNISYYESLGTGGSISIQAPEGELTVVYSDVTKAASLWEFNAEAMRDAMLLHNKLLRGLIEKHKVVIVIRMHMILLITLSNY